MRAAALAVSWVLTRALVVYLLLGPERKVEGSLGYLGSSVRHVPTRGLGRTLVEYPLPAVVVLAVPMLLALLTGLSFGHALAVVALLTDLAFTVLLRTRGGPRWAVAATVWVLAVPAIGPTAYARFDLLPGVLVGAALLFYRRSAQGSAVAVALAAVVKLWPLLVLPAVVLSAPRRMRASVVAMAGAVVVAVFGLAGLIAGTRRLLSPFRYDSHRGLQIEAVAASPVMLLRLVHPHGYRVFFAASKSFEIVGRGAGKMLTVTTLGTALLVLAVLAASWWAWRRRAVVGAEVVVWMTLAPVTGFIVVSKVLSPQYLLWLLPSAAAAAAVLQRGLPPLLRWSVGLLVASVLTQAVFPFLYGGLTHLHAQEATAVTTLAVRNLLLVVLAVWAWLRMVASLRAEREAPAVAAAPSPTS